MVTVLYKAESIAQAPVNKVFNTVCVAGGVPTCASDALPRAPEGSLWPHGRACDSVPVGGTCKATCDDDYGAPCSPPEAVCRQDGSWSITGGECKRSKYQIAAADGGKRCCCIQQCHSAVPLAMPL